MPMAFHPLRRLFSCSSCGRPGLHRKCVRQMRMRDGKQVELPFNYREVLKGDKPEQNIDLEPGDTIVVP